MKPSCLLVQGKKWPRKRWIFSWSWVMTKPKNITYYNSMKWRINATGSNYSLTTVPVYKRRLCPCIYNLRSGPIAPLHLRLLMSVLATIVSPFPRERFTIETNIVPDHRLLHLWHNSVLWPWTIFNKNVTNEDVMKLWNLMGTDYFMSSIEK